jgi:hypothetical protein
MFRTWAGWRVCTRLAAAGLTLGALIAAAPAESASNLGRQAAVSASGPVAGTANGPVRGLAKGAPMSAGIPYAAPPVGAALAAAAPAASWLACARHAARAAFWQLAGPSARPARAGNRLFLNASRPPPAAGSQFPVMVWAARWRVVSGEYDYDPRADGGT